jgi:DNA-binding GntR family transcriptional regulator
MMIKSESFLSEHQQLQDVVAERLRAQISAGKLMPGEWLRQERLAAELGTSYTPIREALKQLEAEGLVEHVPYHGVRVVQFSADDVEDIYTIRSVLEGLAAASAAGRLTGEQLAELCALHEQMSAHPGDIERMREWNRQFHQIIIEASGRTYLIRTLKAVWTWSPAMLWSQFAHLPGMPDNERAEEDNAEHAEILRALEAHDAAAAERAMRSHIDRAWRALVAHVKG